MAVETRLWAGDARFRRSFAFPGFVFAVAVTYSYLGVFEDIGFALPLPSAYSLEIVLLALALLAVCQDRHNDRVASYLVAFAPPFAWYWMLATAVGLDMGRTTPSEAFLGSAVVAALQAVPVFAGGYGLQRAYRALVDA